MAKFQRKPAEIEAVQWVGDNYEEIKGFTDDKVFAIPDEALVVPTYQGERLVHPQDWITKTKGGVLDVNKDFVFRELHEPM